MKTSGKKSPKRKPLITARPPRTIASPPLEVRLLLGWEQVRALLRLHDAGYERGYEVLPKSFDVVARAEAKRVRELAKLGLAERNNGTGRSVHHYRITAEGERFFR